MECRLLSHSRHAIGTPKANVMFAEIDLLSLHETDTAFQVPVNALVVLETTSEGPHATAQFEPPAPRRKTGHHCPQGVLRFSG